MQIIPESTFVLGDLLTGLPFTSKEIAVAGIRAVDKKPNTNILTLEYLLPPYGWIPQQRLNKSSIKPTTRHAAV